MSYIDKKRLSPKSFSFDFERIRRGDYSDQYFNNAQKILTDLARVQNLSFGKALSSKEQQALEAVGNREVDFQIFTRRYPQALVVGTDQVLALLKGGCGYFDEKGQFVSTYQNLQVRSLFDGATVVPWRPVMRIRGRYRDFGYLETLLLGFLSRSSKIATNVYEVLKAASGKPVLYFSARYDHPETQEGDGYACKIAVDRYNREEKKQVPLILSTNAQGSWFGQKGGGTTSHAYLLCFLRNTPEALYYFAEIMDPQIHRIALVDVNNHCIQDSLATARRFFLRYLALWKEGHIKEAQKFKLYGVRADTAGNMRDQGISPLGDPRLDCGVTPRLVLSLREALDGGPASLDLSGEDLELARKYYSEIKIFCTGGFDKEKINLFERLGIPADGYGVGSAFVSGEKCDYTGDIVMVKEKNQWIPMAKEGREALENEDLEEVVNWED